MIEFLQHIINGFSLGSIYALIALGYTLVFGVLQLINFAHGDVFMLGAFSGYYLSRWIGLYMSGTAWGQPGWPLFVTVFFLSMLVCALIGFIIERFAYRPLRKQPRINVLITAVGVSLFLEYSCQTLFGGDPKYFPLLIDFGPPLEFQSIQSQGVPLQINRIQLLVLTVSLALMAVLHLFLKKTRQGKALRAVAYNHQFASLMGINVDLMISLTFMIGSALASAAGILVGLTYPRIEPLMGVMPGLKAFVAAVFGGIGNIAGAVTGALIMGLAEEMVVGYSASTYRDALAFALLILVLIFRPSGLFGSKSSEKV